MREYKYQIAGVENAEVENAGVVRRSEKCITGKT